MILVFSGFSFIIQLAHHFDNFRRYLRKSFAANCTFLLAAHRAVSSANWDFEFCLWWGFGKSLTYIRKSNGLRTEPCGTPAKGLILSERKPFTLTWIIWPTRKSESQHVSLVGRSSMKILYLSPLCLPNIVKSFFYVKKSSHYMFSSVKDFHTGLGKPEEIIISRLILSET